MINSEFKDNIPSGNLLVNSLQGFQPAAHELLILFIQMHFMHSASVQPAPDPLSDDHSWGAQIVQSVLEDWGEGVGAGTGLGLVGGDPLRIDFAFYYEEHLGFGLAF